LQGGALAFFRHFAEGLGHSDPISGLPEAAVAWGWHAVDGDPFESGLVDQIHDVARALHGVFASTSIAGGSHSVAMRMTFRDAYQGTVAGRAITVANGWMPIEAVVAGGRRVEGSAVVAVELSTVLLIAGIEPRGRHHAIRGLELATGNPAFDAAYRVVGVGTPADRVVTAEMQQRIGERSDWAFLASETLFVMVAAEPFATADEVSQRVSEVLGIVAAVPSSIAPAQIDHSVDDLLVRISRIDTVDDALVFLQQLSDADRQRLAQSPTPLARFADVRTPDEAMARLASLSDEERLQVVAMFQKADGS
jgi:hypothetical protein